MSLVLPGATSGQITLDVPAVAGTNSITLPANSGTIITTGSNGQAIPKLALPTGSVLQVVQGTTTTTVANQTTSYVDSTLSASITPLSSTSKILVIVGQMVRVYSQTNNYLVGRVQLLRGSTVVGAYANAMELASTTSGNGYMISGATQAFNYLDSPATTSSTTYKTQIAVSTTGSGSTCEAQSAGSLSTILLLEIAA